MNKTLKILVGLVIVAAIIFSVTVAINQVRKNNRVAALRYFFVQADSNKSDSEKLAAFRITSDIIRKNQSLFSVDFLKAKAGRALTQYCDNIYQLWVSYWDQPPADWEEVSDLINIDREWVDWCT